MNHSLQLRLDRIHPHIRDMASAATGEGRRVILFFSFTDGTKRATVVTTSGDTFDEAWACGMEQVGRSGTAIRWLRVDAVDAVEPRTWREVKATLSKIKRNYFRLGISLDASFETAFLETEINANAMVYGGGREATATLNEKNFSIYAATRHGLTGLSFRDDDTVWLFTTKGVFVGDDRVPWLLTNAGLDAGRRNIAALTPADVQQLIQSGSGYLATQVLESGRFEYGWHPCFDRPIRSYNSLRHASTLYAMIEAWEVTRDDHLWRAITRALDYLTEELIELLPLPGGGDAAFLVDQHGEIKLGGNAVAILALAKHSEVTGEGRYRELAEKLGAGILHMQDPATGAFTHVLHHPSLDVKQQFRIIYYDGEAAFGLMRLYELTGDQRWIDAVEKAFAYFISKEHWRAHDHWLGYCVNELTTYRAEERYFRFGLDNFRDHLDFVLERITTFPTLLELMTAAESMVTRLRSDPDLRHLLEPIDLQRFYKALHHRAHYLLNGHFWPELAMFYANPQKIVGSFFIRHHAFRVRIDDVEHYLSGLVAYRRYLLRRSEAATAVQPRSAGGQRRHWSAADVERATGGRWQVAPPPGWSASGLCIASPTIRDGDMVVVRPPGGNRGVPEARRSRLSSKPAAWIVSDAEQIHAEEPTLFVHNVNSAIINLGRYARDQMVAKFVGVTGSAGKTTTVGMLAHLLEPYGEVGTTRHNANLPHGIAWNLASIPWNVPHVVLELAIGRIGRSSRLIRPDVAVFTNVLPAHLEYHPDLATIAERKSAIFEGMKAGSTAVINRDMAEHERVYMAAKEQGLNVLHYGRSSGCEFQLLEYDPHSRLVTARLGERTVSYALGAAGEHMALNSLAALATVRALGLDVGRASKRLASFSALEGRGVESDLMLQGRQVLLIDESYNANPGSVEAALALLGSKTRAGRRIAVLGEMRELGDEAASYHTRLAPLIARNAVDRVYALGELYGGFWAAIPEACRAGRPSSLDELKQVLMLDLRDGDALLVKGSHGTGLHELVHFLTFAGEPDASGSAPCHRILTASAKT